MENPPLPNRAEFPPAQNRTVSGVAIGQFATAPHQPRGRTSLSWAIILNEFQFTPCPDKDDREASAPRTIPSIKPKPPSAEAIVATSICLCHAVLHTFCHCSLSFWNESVSVLWNTLNKVFVKTKINEDISSTLSNWYTIALFSKNFQSKFSIKRPSKLPSELVPYGHLTKNPTWDTRTGSRTSHGISQSRNFSSYLHSPCNQILTNSLKLNLIMCRPYKDLKCIILIFFNRTILSARTTSTGAKIQIM